MKKFIRFLGLLGITTGVILSIPALAQMVHGVSPTAALCIAEIRSTYGYPQAIFDPIVQLSEGSDRYTLFVIQSPGSLINDETLIQETGDRCTIAFLPITGHATLAGAVGEPLARRIRQQEYNTIAERLGGIDELQTYINDQAARYLYYYLETERIVVLKGMGIIIPDNVTDQW